MRIDRIVLTLGLMSGSLAWLACSTVAIQSGDRGPSSTAPVSGPAKDLTDSQYSIFSDYFLSSDQDVRFLMEPRFSSNADNEYLSSRARQSLHEAFSRAFFDLAQAGNASHAEQDTAGSAGSLAGRFKANLPSAILSNFAKTITVYKIFGLRLQFDLAFVPEPIDPESYEMELASNGLTSLARRKRLAPQLRDLANPNSDLKKVLALTRQRRVANEPVFVGGAITLEADILNLNPVKAVGPDDQVFSGELRFRRFLAHRAPDVLSTHASSRWKFMTAAYSHSESTIVSTVDLVYDLDRKHKPVLSRIDLYPGQIVMPSETPGKSPRLQSTADFEVRGTSGIASSRPLQVIVERVSYDPVTLRPLEGGVRVRASRHVSAKSIGSALATEQAAMLQTLAEGLVERGGVL